MPLGLHSSDLGWLAIGVAVVWNMILGFIWFAPWSPTGKVWMKGMGMAPDFKPDQKGMMRSMLMMIVGTILAQIILAHVVLAFSYAKNPLSILDGAHIGFMVWLGFYLPLNMGAVMWENKSWGFALTTTAYYLLAIVVSGIIMVALG